MPAVSWAQVDTPCPFASPSPGIQPSATSSPDQARSERCFVALNGSPSHQEPTSGPRPVHRFADRLNIALTVAGVGALLADGATTQYLMKNYPGGREVDPLARPFVENGWPGQILGGTLFIGAEVGLRYVLHRKGHHRVERWFSTIPITYGGVCAVHNLSVIKESQSFGIYR
jgi:hypothetical protein